MHKHFKQLTAEQLALNEKFQQLYNDHMTACNAATARDRELIQAYYNKIHDLQASVQCIENAYRDNGNKIRQQAVLA